MFKKILTRLLSPLWAIKRLPFLSLRSYKTLPFLSLISSELNSFLPTFSTILDPLTTGAKLHDPTLCILMMYLLYSGPACHHLNVWRKRGKFGWTFSFLTSRSSPPKQRERISLFLELALGEGGGGNARVKCLGVRDGPVLDYGRVARRAVGSLMCVFSFFFVSVCTKAVYSRFVTKLPDF